MQLPIELCFLLVVYGACLSYVTNIPHALLPSSSISDELNMKVTFCAESPIGGGNSNIKRMGMII